MPSEAHPHDSDVDPPSDHDAAMDDTVLQSREPSKRTHDSSDFSVDEKKLVDAEPSFDPILELKLPKSESQTPKSAASENVSGEKTEVSEAKPTSEDGQQDRSSLAPNQWLLSRYKLENLLGEGGYGRVFKAYDQQLQRHVAIKIPHRHYDTSSRSLEKYLEEARTLAKLQHPRVVSVYDVLVADDAVPCIVSAYVDGTSLAVRMQSNPLTLREGVGVLIEIGEALGYVHSRGVVHRDVKPGNILINEAGASFLADFGLALRDEKLSPIGTKIGTPAYMSPEQARGESHLVDGRSDIFSLGVILYELLTGRRPFGNRNRQEIYDRLLNQETQPPRQLNPSIPRELERICLKALSKQASHRYPTATDWVDDLEHFLSTLVVQSSSTTEHFSNTSQEVSFSQAAAPVAAESADQVPNDQVPNDQVPNDQVPNDQGSKSKDPAARSAISIGVIPRGLQSYDRHDKDFFSSLLPGPRDRDWVPESLRFWQRQITKTDGHDPLRVGVLYGPSGCGKSSFVKAGLMPLITSDPTSADMHCVFIEATRDDTEARLLRGLRRRYPSVPTQAGLIETLAHIRQSGEMDQGGRVLLVIDQFEQWLHGREDNDVSILPAVLRQCDGISIQCLLLVRDDFWLALSRFMGQLEIPIKQNVNASLVDLFTPEHARKVLHALGVAYHRLPIDPREFTSEQASFLDRAVEDLAEGGKVFPIRLSLFVEMVKTEIWTGSTLNRLGGIRGIGLTFLEESFSSDLAPAAQRIHEPAVRRVLRKLLPAAGVAIKGNMQPESVLIEAAGYQEQPGAFAAMMRILETDLRLISPTDPGGTTSSSDDSQSGSQSGLCYYQLTHDFLVPAVTEWLTMRQQQTRRGRAELRLAEYTSLWSGKRDAKFAPTWSDWINISVWSDKSHWNATEQKMMRATTKRYLSRTVLIAGLLLVCVFAAWWFKRRSTANSLVDQLQTARIDRMRPLLEQIEQQGSFAIAPLRAKLASDKTESTLSWRNHLALLGSQYGDADEVVRRSLSIEPAALILIADKLKPLNQSAIGILSDTLQDANADPQVKLNATMLLSLAAPESELVETSIQSQGTVLVRAMIDQAKQAPQDSPHLIEGIAPIALTLLAPLKEIAYQEQDSPDRSLATSFLTQFLDQHPVEMLHFFTEASLDQHPQILPKLRPHLESLEGQLRGIADDDPDLNLPEPEYDPQAKKQAIAIALLNSRGEFDLTWPMLKSRPWPHVRSYLIDRIAALGGEFEVCLNRFSREPEVSVRRALLLVLGKFDWETIDSSTRARAERIVREAFETDPDVGTHSAAEWLLCRWGRLDWVDEFLKSSAGKPRPSRQNWFVNTRGHTMAVFDATDVPEIGRVFAIDTKETTVADFQEFLPDHEYYEERSPTPDCPIGNLDWFHSTAYCRWLSERENADVEHAYPSELNQDNPDVPCDFVLEHASYRLPTADEWIFAAGAGTTSSRYIGLGNQLVDFYLRYYETSLDAENRPRYFPFFDRPPNDFGMFAMSHGIREWGHSTIWRRRAIMGGSNNQDLLYIQRDYSRETGKVPTDLPQANNGYYGVRVAMTITEP